MRWSFDDNHIGQIEGAALKTREVKRPSGLYTKEWYDFASQVCKILNGQWHNDMSTAPRDQKFLADWNGETRVTRWLDNHRTYHPFAGWIPCDRDAYSGQPTRWRYLP